MDSTETLSHNVVIYANMRKCLKQKWLSVVARDGIEPPTPAFSGLNSLWAIMLKLKAESCLDVPKTAHLLGQEWDKILAGQSCLSHCCPIPLFEFRCFVRRSNWLTSDYETISMSEMIENMLNLEQLTRPL